MITFIPLSYYTPLYFNILLLTFLLIWLNSHGVSLFNKDHLFKKQGFGVFILIVIILYMGLRPISGAYFGDMGTYANVFQNYAESGGPFFNQDLGFNIFMLGCAKIMNVNMFFLLCAFLYVFPLYLASQKLFRSYWLYAFLILVGSFSFWAFGTNGIRNGIATSLILLAFAYSDRKIVMIVLMFVAVSFHKSMIIPIAAFIITLFYKDSKKLFYFWLLCIPLSLMAGGFFESLFSHIGLSDARTSYLTAGNVNDDQFSHTGFRWDFLLYSATGIYAGWYFIFKRNFKDPLYHQFFNIYIIANAFWILIIRSNFSNRFAYLSWFMLGVIIIYPFLKRQFFKNQYQVLDSIIFLYFIFTYVMNVILVRQ
jgi:hypothetical protein